MVERKKTEEKGREKKKDSKEEMRKGKEIKERLESVPRTNFCPKCVTFRNQVTREKQSKIEKRDKTKRKPNEQESLQQQMVQRMSQASFSKHKGHKRKILSLLPSCYLYLSIDIYKKQGYDVYDQRCLDEVRNVPVGNISNVL